VAVEGQRELDDVVVVEVGDGDADEREALTLDQRRRGRQQPADGGQDRLGLGGRPSQRVRASRP
jgi:hypothetical protein